MMQKTEDFMKKLYGKVQNQYGIMKKLNACFV